VAPRPAQPPVQGIPGLSPGVKRPGRGVDHQLTSSAEVTNGLELYIHLHSVAEQACHGVTLTFTFVI
jgi:hypothetical protein